MSIQPKTIYLKDYEPPSYWVDTIDLVFHLQEDETTVLSTLHCRKNDVYRDKNNVSFVLQGRKLKLKSLKLNGKNLTQNHYQLDEETLTIPNSPETFTLEIETEIHPEKNTELSGLYRTKTMFCTQCEAEGFRTITYYPDRPDVMAKFTTTIYADKKRYPVLLSNGNCVENGEVDKDRHWVKWVDPFKKPCYLFALVAGDLVSLEDYFVTMSGRLVTLKIFVERENQDKCQHAMAALKKAMKWDEETYGREYDLDIYMIVATNDFNMGAMENKGLNIFNSKYILARPESATDTDYHLIDAVVGHEYFHNWSGNRITCRDWFQLSLKEGLTVFREHQFSSDISKSPISLIENVRHLRATQFVEDAGPMAHSVRPESYIEINNFYTTTVYEKGAEVIRMLKNLLGWETFRRGMDLYFERYDGEAVTTDDFVAAMEAASKQDLSQFRLWYSQAGTPEVTIQADYSKDTETFTLTLKQYCPPTPSQPDKKPMVIPVAVGLLDKKGADLLPETKVLVLNETEQTFKFSNIKAKPIPSLLRGFSAPVTIKFSYTEEELAFLLAEDSDDFNRWEAGQKFSERVIWELVDALQTKRELKVNLNWLEANRLLINHKTLNPALKAEILTLPSLGYLIGLKNPADLDSLYAARTCMRQALVQYTAKDLRVMYERYSDHNRYQYTPEAVSARRLKNLSLSFLMLLKDASVRDLCMAQWRNAHNMTDSLGVLGALVDWEGKERAEVLDEFYERWQHDPNVLDKWFRIQASSELPNTLEVVKGLTKHPAFSIKNPNKVYSLVGTFGANLVRFHDKNGEGYVFLADTVLELNALNPQVAAKMMNPLTRWKQFDPDRQQKMKVQLQRIYEQPNLSKDIYEVVSKCLQ